MQQCDAGAIGLRLLTLRQRAKKSQTQVAQAAGYSQAWTFRIEAGVRDLRLWEAAAIAEVLGLGVVELCGILAGELPMPAEQRCAETETEK